MNTRKIDIKQNYEQGEKQILGDGAYSKVFTVVNKYSKRKYALKKVTLKDRQK